jgi:single-strand DNA-binding protein
MNQLALSGYLTADPELGYRDERPICTMRLAVANGRHPTTFIDVRTFDEQAYICAEFMHRGSRIAIEGRLAYDEWRGPGDEKRCRYSAIGRVEFLDPPPRKEERSSTDDVATATAS